MKLNKKMKSPALERNNYASLAIEQLSGKQLHRKKELRVLVNNSLKQCVLAVEKAKSLLGCLWQNLASRLREVILTLKHSQRWVQFWATHSKINIDALSKSSEGSQR